MEIAFHTTSLRFGTFLFNSSQERDNNNISKETTSLWAYLNSHRKFQEIKNLYYVQEENFILNPVVDKDGLKLWLQFFLSGQSEQKKYDENISNRDQITKQILQSIDASKNLIKEKQAELDSLTEQLKSLRNSLQ